jgi:steroid 5-alpha reductase family enzyme
MIAAATLVAAPGLVTLVAAIALAILFVGLWGVSVLITDVSIVDPVWGPAFALVALVGLIVGDADVSGGGARRLILLAMTAIWGLRLGGYLLVRKLREPAEDRRYAEMRRRRGGGFELYSLVMIFALQGLLVLVVSLPLQVAAERGAGLDWLVWAGVAVWAVGVFFESVGDWQMARFKSRPGRPADAVMDEGLWRYTRHPNYFGDFCVWWGLWLAAVGAGGTWWTVVGPLVMSWLLIKGTGAALTEKGMAERRPKYADYVRRTSGFVPRPPRARD